MKVIIAGSRIISNENYIFYILDTFNFNNWTIVSGGAKGIDSLAKQYSIIKNIPFIEMKADWDKYGKSAGYIRNIEMANISNGLIAFWDQKSKGTKMMIDIMLKQKKEIKVYHI